MINLYLASFEPYSGKTAICLAMGLHYIEKGVRVKYLKPVSTIAMIEGKPVSWDAVFLREKLQIEEPPEMMSPVLVSPHKWEEMLDAPENQWQDTVLEAYRKLSAGADLMLLEGAVNMTQGYALGLSAKHITSLIDSRVLLVMNYKPDLYLDSILSARDRLQDHLSGIIVNRIPESMTATIKGQIQRVMGRYGIPVVGMLPEDSLLCSISVSELAEILDGEILNVNNSEGVLIENFSVGAMNTEQALTYFRRIPKKAVITGGDRVDIQLAALETDTRCLILTGNYYPASVVLTQAAIQQVPIILAHTSTMEAVRKVDETLGHIRLRHAHQIKRLRDMIESDPGLAELSRSLGLPAS
ncbi:MAG: phosphotransacetylase family protein [Chloroflexota bacterium]